MLTGALQCALISAECPHWVLLSKRTLPTLNHQRSSRSTFLIVDDDHCSTAERIWRKSCDLKMIISLDQFPDWTRSCLLIQKNFPKTSTRSSVLLSLAERWFLGSLMPHSEILTEDSHPALHVGTANSAVGREWGDWKDAGEHCCSRSPPARWTSRSRFLRIAGLVWAPRPLLKFLMLLE